jgi:lantibiotic modifying enzyme
MVAKKIYIVKLTKGIRVYFETKAPLSYCEKSGYFRCIKDIKNIIFFNTITPSGVGVDWTVKANIGRVWKVVYQPVQENDLGKQLYDRTGRLMAFSVMYLFF